jgi:hypothetical protein
MTDKSVSATVDTKPQLGVISAMSYLIGNIVGSGIFISPTLILNQVGSVGEHTTAARYSFGEPCGHVPKRVCEWAV